MSRDEKIQAAIYAALGVVKIDYSTASKIDEAAAQITKFVVGAIDEWKPQWIREYEKQLYSDEGPSGGHKPKSTVN
jgi:hypothetical protein